jgi:mannose-1-phosphate guanylyltransferase
VGEEARGPVNEPAFHVKAFVEKPDLKTAEKYLRQGGYFWHLGLFSWKVKVLFDEMAKHAAGLYQGLARFDDAQRHGSYAAADMEYLALPTEAIDNAVLERSGNLLMVRAQFEWHDVGSWADLHDILEQDAAGNFVEGEHVLIDSKDCMIHSPRKLVAAVGLEGMVVIETEDALLICPKARSQDVKLIVERLKQMGKKEYL